MPVQSTQDAYTGCFTQTTHKKYCPNQLITFFGHSLQLLLQHLGYASSYTVLSGVCRCFPPNLQQCWGLLAEQRSLLDSPESSCSPEAMVFPDCYQPLQMGHVC